MTSIDDLAATVRAGLAQDEHFAREACGGTVVGERGNWRQAPGGDEWAAEQVDDFVMLVVALRPGVKRSDPESRGLWGQIAAWQDDGDGYKGPLIEFTHAARHDPHRVLAEVASKRALVDAALEWEHVEHEDDWHSCPAVESRAERYGSGQCDCGRDERVLAVLQHLAQPYQETT